MTITIDKTVFNNVTELNAKRELRRTATIPKGIC